MRIFDANNECVLFWGLLLKVIISKTRNLGTFSDDVSNFRQRIEDENGADITHLVRDLTLTVEQGTQRAWAQLELNRPGFDGPFCTPQIGF